MIIAGVNLAVKQVLLCLTFITSTVVIFAQNPATISCEKFKINLHIQNADTGLITLNYFGCDGNGKTLKAQLNKGRLSFEGSVNRATQALLILDPNEQNLDAPTMLRIILEPGETTISGSFNASRKEVLQLNITGSISQSEKQLWEQENAIALQARQFDTITRLVAEYVLTHPDSYFSAYLLDRYQNKFMVDSLIRYYGHLNYAAQNSSFGLSVLDYLFTKGGMDFRDQYNYNNLNDRLKNINGLFDVTLKDKFEKDVTLSVFKGKPSLLFFWGSWCVPCHRLAPFLDSVKASLPEDAIHFIAVSLNTNGNDWLHALGKYHIPGINLIDKDNILRMYYGFLAVPHIVIVDANGKTVNANAPDPDNQQLLVLLKEVLKQ